MALLIPEFLHTKLYSAKALRAMLGDTLLQPGVLGPTDLKVVQRAAGANMSVDVGAGAAWVAATGTRQGNYHAYNDATVNLAIGNNATGNPRLDQIILRIYDTTDGAAAQDIAALEVLPGTANAGTTLDTRTGAAALPNSSIRIADVLVANGAASIANAVIRDRRPWGRGAYSRTLRTSANFVQAATGPIVIIPTPAPRVECSGAPVRMTLHTTAEQSSAAGQIRLYPLVDGVPVDGIAAAAQWASQNLPSVGHNEIINLQHVTVPAAGSHVFQWGLTLNAGVVTLLATAIAPMALTVEELLRPSADNS